jgi:hypothetical protein
VSPGVPLQPGIWIVVAGIVVLALIGIAAIVYALSGPLDSPNARGWAKLQIYEGILALVLVSVFVVFSYLFLLDPTNALTSVGLMTPTSPCATSAGTDMYSMATCEIASFNGYSFQLFQALLAATIYLSYTPGFSLSVTLGGSSSNLQVTMAAFMDSLIPISAEVSLGFAFSGFLFLFLLNQLQVLLLSGALFWLGFFVSLGLIARAFGFLRSFGGAMIAMGLGLGFVYPLITLVTYGFLNVQLFNPALPQGAATLGADIYQTIIAIALQGAGIAVPTPTTSWVFPIGIALAGLTFIPFLNFTIVDAFIVDFSKAIGERLDFMSLMVGII